MACSTTTSSQSKFPPFISRHLHSVPSLIDPFFALTRLPSYRSRREEEEPLEKELKAENERLSAGLMELKSVQSKLMEEVESARAEKAVLTKKQVS